MTTTPSVSRLLVNPMDYNESDLTRLPVVLRRTSWGAIIGGASVAAAVQLVLGLLGVAIGLTAVLPEYGSMGTTAEQARDAAQTIGLGAGIWWLVTGVLSLLLGGMVVGKIAGINRSCELAIHGFTMWAITAVIGFLFIWSAAGMMTVAGSNVVRPMSIGFQPMDSALMPMSRQLLSPASRDSTANQQSPGTTSNAASNAGTQAETPESRARVNAEYRPTDQEVERLRKAARSASWWTLLALALGAGAATGGAWLAAPQRSIVTPSTTPAP